MSLYQKCDADETPIIDTYDEWINNSPIQKVVITKKTHQRDF